MTPADELLEIVDDHRGDAPATRERPVRRAVIERGHGIAWYIDAGKAAITTGRLLSDSGWVCPVESADQLREAIEHVAATDEDVAAFIGACNQRRQQLQGSK